MDDVVPAPELLPSQQLGEVLPGAVAVGGDTALRVIAPNGVHPLLAAVARAFADHRPLVLSPDAVWLTIAQGIAQHVRLHSEKLRPLLVGHQGRKPLVVTAGGAMPQEAKAWHTAVDSWAELLAAEVTDADLFECDFSTSTEVERTASRVVLLDAYSPYFAYWLVAVCGIPTISLTGTLDDWQRIRARVDRLDVFGLEAWCRSLAPITDQFVRAAVGDVDTEFWKRIYNPVDAYGGELITGWIARLYPYLQGDGAVDLPNEMLDLPITEPRGLTDGDRSGYCGPGVRSDNIPATLSRVIVNVSDRTVGSNHAMALHAGLVGVAQDLDGSLRAVAGWYLTPAEIEIDDVIDRIIRDHDTSPPQPLPRWFYGSAELVTLYHRIGAATLFDDAWRLLPAKDHRTTLCSSGIRVIIELSDGRSICTYRDVYWVICRLEPTNDPHPLADRFRFSDPPSDIPIYGTSLALLLDTALDSGGDIAHAETGRLSDLDASQTRTDQV